MKNILVVVAMLLLTSCFSNVYVDREVRKNTSKENIDKIWAAFTKHIQKSWAEYGRDYSLKDDEVKNSLYFRSGCPKKECEAKSIFSKNKEAEDYEYEIISIFKSGANFYYVDEECVNGECTYTITDGMIVWD